jgi:hypothetical protein
MKTKGHSWDATIPVLRLAIPACRENRLAQSNTPFYAEIQALDENFWQYYYAYQRDWLERGQINFQAVQSLWDILNNVYDNLDDLNIKLEELTPALELVETMNTLANDVQKKGAPTEAGIVFSGTRQEYEAIGSGLLDKLYELEPHINAARQRLIQMAHE